MRTVVGERCEAVVAAGLTHGEVHNLNFRVFLSPFVIQSVAHFFGLLHARANRQFEGYAQAAVVAHWDKLATDKLHKTHRCDEYAKTDEDGGSLATNHQSKQFCVGVVEAVQALLDRCEDFLHKTLLVGTAQTKHLAAEHRCEREGASGRNNHHDAHHPAKLTEEHTRHTFHKRQWEEHRNKSER